MKLRLYSMTVRNALGVNDICVERLGSDRIAMHVDYNESELTVEQAKTLMEFLEKAVSTN